MGISDTDEEPIEEPPAERGEDGENRATRSQIVAADGEGSIEDSEEEEEDALNYEDDGFVVDEEDEGEDTDGSDTTEKHRSRKRKKKKREHDDLEVEDFSWIGEENAELSRKQPGRRLKKGGAEVSIRLGSIQNRRAENFADLEDFHDDDDDSQFHRDERSYDRDERVYGGEDDLDIDDFIVDEAADRRKAQGNRRSRDRGISAAYKEALREVAEIFGDADELVTLYEDNKKQKERQNKDSSPQGKNQLGRPLDQCDPEALAMHCLLPEDDEIRKRDIPERFQLRMGPGPQEFEYDIATEWIYKHMLSEEDGSPELEILENGQKELDGPTVEDVYIEKDPSTPCTGHRVVRSLRTSESRLVWKTDEFHQAALKKSIKSVLQHIYEDNEEIPYIATYRKEECGDLLCLADDEIPSWMTADEYTTQKDDGSHCPPPGSVQATNVKMKRWQLLWKVFNLSLKWRRLRRRVEKRLEVFKDVQESHRDDSQTYCALFSCIENMSVSTTGEDADMADERFRLSLAALGKEIPDKGMGLNPQIQRYKTYCQTGYREVVEAMAIRKSIQMELKLSGEEQEAPKCFSVDLDDMITDIMQKNAGAVGIDAVMMGVRHVAVMELSCQPEIRSAVLSFYEEHATVTTTPTETGERVLDPFHIYGYVKRLLKAPISSLKGDTFLKIVAATRSHYLDYSVDIDEEIVKERLIPSLNKIIFEFSLENLKEGWSQFRNDVILSLLNDHLLPSTKSEVVQKLGERSRRVVLNGMGEAFWKFAIQAPFKPATEEANYEEHESLVRVCACCWGHGGLGQPSTVLVMLDTNGELRDMIELKQFSGFFDSVPAAEMDGSADVLQDERKKEDAQKIREFLMDHKPHVVVVGGSRMICKQLAADLEEIRDNFLTEHSRYMVVIQGNMEVMLYSEMIPSIWENSPAAQTELPDHSAHVRRAVALGRCLIDPISVLASLRDHSDTILSVKFTDLEEWIMKEERLAKIDEVMVTALNQIGAELNLMANVPWRSHSLQFVAGLGRRKALGLINLMNRNSNRMESRAELITNDYLGTSILKTCIGFLLINGSNLAGMANMDFDPLDETRVHPDSYSLAKELAMIAVENKDPEGALIELGEKPFLIRSVDLISFNQRGVEKGRKYQLSTLIDIAMELFSPFHDRRPQFSKPTELEIFYMLVNEKAETMRPGRIVEAIVEYVEPQEVHCCLTQSKLKGIIKQDQFTTAESSGVDLNTLRRGDVFRARLIGIDTHDLYVELSCREVDLADDAKWERAYCTHENYYFKPEEEKEKDSFAKKADDDGHFKPRRIDHPLFKNVSEAESREILSRHPLGYAILRPSEAGQKCITLSFIAFSGKEGDVMMHRNIVEGPKVEGVRTSMKLGLPLKMMLTSSLYITFDDLDEVVPLFVDPYIERVKSLKMHRKFRDGSSAEVEAYVREEKRRAGLKNAVYVLSADYTRPGAYYIAAIVNVSFGKEYFTIVPDGYYFRKQVFKHLEAMISEFKRRPQAQKVRSEFCCLDVILLKQRTAVEVRSVEQERPTVTPSRVSKNEEDSEDDMKF